MTDRHQINKWGRHLLARCYATSLVVSIMFASSDSVIGQTLDTKGDCSPALVNSPVSGSIVVNCPIHQQDLASVAQTLTALQKNNTLTAAQMNSFLQVTNILLGKILAKDNRAASDVTTIAREIRQIGKLQEEEISILREAPADTKNVTSENQSGGVTAFNVGTVNQIVPKNDRRHYAIPLSQFYSQGVKIMDALSPLNKPTDDEIDKATADADAWTGVVDAWLLKNMGSDAQTMFHRDSLHKVTFRRFPGQSGDHKPGEEDKRDDAYNAMSNRLENVAILVNSDAYDPVSH